MPQILQNTLPKNDADTWWLIDSEKKPNDTSTDTHFPESSKKITTAAVIYNFFMEIFSEAFASSSQKLSFRVLFFFL